MPAPDAATRARVVAAAGRALNHNWRHGHRSSDGVSYAFTCPATPRYRHQWYWDSCFHAIAWRHFDVARARAELRTLLRAGRLDGFIPHTAFWDRPAYWRRAPFYGTHTVFGCTATATIQTPLLALAWELVAQASADDPAFSSEALPQLRLHYDWLARERDVDRDGLLTTITPDESGLDDSPKYDRVLGWMRHDRPGHFWLIERYRRLSYDAAQIAQRYDEHVEDVVVNVFYTLGLQALARLDVEHGEVYAARARETIAALLSRCYDERTGLFFDLAGAAEHPLRVSTWSSLAPLALRELPPDIRRRLVEGHLLHPRRYRAACGIPSVAIEEPAFNPNFATWRCWRGPSWMNTSWLLVPAMRELGYAQEAQRIVDSLVRAVDRYGFREYYNPLTGRGLGALGFGFSTLLVDLLAVCGNPAQPVGHPSGALRIIGP
ncbi:MAG: MGH1-like glycoside hydrolase domain-containing protein [Solirubrobacteraceae bacterium]